MADSPLTPRPQVRSTSQPVAYDVSARTVDQGANIQRAPNADLMGLVEGLRSFNPALDKFAAVQHQKDAQDIAFAEKRAQEAGSAAAERSPREVPADLAAAPDAGFVGTFKSVYQGAFRHGIAERNAQDMRAAVTTEYLEKKDLPDFNLPAFLQNHRAHAMAGLPDDMAMVVGKRFDDIQSSLQANYDDVRLKRLNEARESSIGALLSNSLMADKPEEVVKRYFAEVQPTVEGLGKTKKEGAQYLLGHLINLSDKAKGLPELFDSFMTERDPNTGKTLFEMNPSLQQHIQSAKEKAQRQRDKIVEENAFDGNMQYGKQLEDRLAKEPFGITWDEITSNTGKLGYFKSDNEAIGFYKRLMAAQGAAAEQTNLLNDARDGKLWLHEEKDQKRVMHSLTAGAVQGLSDAISKNDTGSVALIGSALIDAHRNAGSTVPSDPIKRMFEFVGTAPPPSKDAKPPAAFLAAAEIYRSFAAKPELREKYFDEGARKVLDGFVKATGAQVDPTEAYKDSYAVVSPEAKARAEAFKKTPEYTEKLSAATKWVTGSSFWPKMFGGNGRPENGGALVADAQQFALDFVSRNPNAKDTDVTAATEAYVGQAYVLDKTTGTAIKIPTGASGQLTSEALGAYTKRKMEELEIGKRDGNWGLTLMLDNPNQGTYRLVTTFNGAPQATADTVSLKGLVDEHRKATLWLPEDAKVMKEAQLAAQAGKPYVNSNLDSIVAKARVLGVQPELVKQINDQQIARARAGLAAIPKLGEGEIDTANLYKTNRFTGQAGIKVSTSQRFLNSSNGSSTGMAASLITMGEGVMYQAYDDPARGAGKNIGTGYNLKANAENAPSDLRRAGVPEERIPGIIAGTEKLSPEQSDRLTLVAVGRYEQLAQKQVESSAPGLWARLPVHQRAVLTDIAYQTGNVGQFKTAIAALTGGDMEAFKAASQVTYVNQSGERVVDKPRNAIRNAMLAGTPYWQAYLQKFGAQPGNALDATALAAKQ